MASTCGLRRKSGQVTATNATLNIRCGFKPEKVVITNRTVAAIGEWHDLMAAGSMDVTTAAGARSNVTSNGVTVLEGDSTNPPGFSIGGSLAHINDTTTEVLMWEAWGQ